MAADQDWTFGGLWPYEPHWFDTADGRMHYVDVGPRGGRPVVLLHGNPTWGFLYRNFIPALTDAGYRAIVPDCLGFGRSDKPTDRRVYAVTKHAGRMEALLESLDLRDATVVPQDWGGPIGLAWAVRHPQRIAGLFIMNTAAHSLVNEFRVPFALRLFRAPVVGEVLVKGLNLFHHGFLFRAGLAQPHRMTPQIKRAYLAPHPTWSSRTGVLQFPREIPTRPTDPWQPFGQYLEDGLAQHFRSHPVKIVWAMKDVSFREDTLEGMWLRSFPNATVVKIAEAGHYLQEDAFERVVHELLTFLDSQPRRATT